MKIKTVNLIDCYELDDLVEKTYNRPFCFQQQEGERGRGTKYVTVPDKTDHERWCIDIPNTCSPKNYDQVKFDQWLKRDPEMPLDDQKNGRDLVEWWHSYCYPNINTLMNDLHRKGLIPAGSYVIDIDW